MPIYEYQCGKCDKIFDIMQKISDPPPKKCEECGGDLAKLISNPSFQLKGTGWYKTDYAASGSSSTSTPEKKNTEHSADAKTTTTKTETASTPDTTKA